jgi:hypothetical protein
MRIGLIVLLAGELLRAGVIPAGTPAVYVIGNLSGISPGSEGVLALEDSQAVFRSGKTVIPIRYQDLHNAELGTRLNPSAEVPVYKVWQLHKRFSTRSAHQMLILEFLDKDGNSQTMTLELAETAAGDTMTALDFKLGKKHRATNGEAWWGDSLWKTPQNQNTVSPEPLGNAPGE